MKVSTLTHYEIISLVLVEEARTILLCLLSPSNSRGRMCEDRDGERGRREQKKEKGREKRDGGEDGWPCPRVLGRLAADPQKPAISHVGRGR